MIQQPKPPVHDAMPDSRDRLIADPAHQPVHDRFGGIAVVGGIDRLVLDLLAQSLGAENRSRLPHPLDLSTAEFFSRIVTVKNRELDAG